MLLHFCIAFVIVAVYYMASRRLRGLRQHPIVCGLLYGLVAYLVMSQIVVPLSAIGRGPFVLALMVNGVLFHALGVGLPAALISARAGSR